MPPVGEQAAGQAGVAVAGRHVREVGVVEGEEVLEAGGVLGGAHAPGEHGAEAGVQLRALRKGGGGRYARSGDGAWTQHGASDVR